MPSLGHAVVSQVRPDVVHGDEPDAGWVDVTGLDGDEAFPDST
jgi:hypothetical protein